MDCVNCGFNIPEGAEICPECGKAVLKEEEQQTGETQIKDRHIMAALSVLFGIIGIPFALIVVFNILAIVFGALGIRSSKRELAKYGVILGIAGLIVSIVAHIVILSNENVLYDVADFLYPIWHFFQK